MPLQRYSAPFLVVSLVVSGLAGAQEPDSTSPWAVWISPIGTVVGAGVTGLSGGLMTAWYLPVGGSVSVGSSWALVGEASLLVGSNGKDEPENQLHRWHGFWASLGPAIQIPSTEANSSFFVQPKIQVASFTDSATFNATGINPLRSTARFGTSVQVGPAVDFGYQLTIGHLYLALALGANLGYCFNCGDSAISGVPWGISTTRSNKFTVGANFNLLRIGYAH